MKAISNLHSLWGQSDNTREPKRTWTVVRPLTSLKFHRGAKPAQEDTVVRLAQRRVVSAEVVAGTEIPGSGGRGRLHLTLHCSCHHQNKMGSDKSHFNISLTVRDKVTKTVSTNANVWRERRAEAKRPVGLLLTSLTPYGWAKRAHNDTLQPEAKMYI